MQCPDCKQYRHDGPCDPYYGDMERYERDMAEPDILEMLAMDAERAIARLDEARKSTEGQHKGEGHERGR
jgi:hypothetical protein